MKKTTFIIAITLLLSACSSQSTERLEAELGNYAAMEHGEKLEELLVHLDDGITQFGSRTDGNNLVLYEIEDNGSKRTQLAFFAPWSVENGLEETEWCRPQFIAYLDVIDQWVILTVGEIQGSMRNFWGDIFRVKDDGTVREPFHIRSFSPSFYIVDGWIYHHIWHLQGGEDEGWYRFRPDGTEKEFLGTAKPQILTSQ
ncbi:MAG: membrane lipoprotein lipid attachment site-containing protein [Defluviitaleaceae bacterium]|nr:membrane lipoprotein lipid attachment site-containing protein [Defluviitaleaceae bacterium]